MGFGSEGFVGDGLVLAYGYSVINRSFGAFLLIRFEISAKMFR